MESVFQEDTNSEKSEVNSWQPTGPDTGSNATRVFDIDANDTEEHKVMSAEGSELNTQSHVMLCVPTWPPGDWESGCTHSQQGVSPKACMDLYLCPSLQEEDDLRKPQLQHLIHLKGAGSCWLFLCACCLCLYANRDVAESSETNTQCIGLSIKGIQLEGGVNSESGSQTQLGEKAFKVRCDWLCAAAVLTAQV
ncbi:hypothetical protein D9C73_024879 [Collichthys lucidus]|uniref:Uncharacterized protein n=1 Tax=Collichthys lucidus TaxID=240159 RepID=A0A4U5VQC4_COLLU|nr:hypothetical protein D9C73_024879 [Collichthys lucidus]